MEHYECATCCYATNTKFIEHGKEHSLENNKDKEQAKVYYVVLVSQEHYDNEENYQGSDKTIKGVFSTRQKAESLSITLDNSTIEEFVADATV